MSRPRILSKPPAQSHAERTMVLATLSRIDSSKMYAYLADCTRTMDTDMLMSALKEGVFAVPMDIGLRDAEMVQGEPLMHSDAVPTQGMVTIDSRPRIMQNIASVFSVFVLVNNESVYVDKNGTDLKQAVSVAKLPASNAFSEFFSELVKGFLEDQKSVMANGIHNLSNAPDRIGMYDAVTKRAFRDTAVGLMALACALDMPEELKALVNGVHGALQAVGSSAYAGLINAPGLKGLGNGRTDQENCRFAAPFFAIHYSSEKCLDVVLAAGWKAYEPFACYKHEDPGLDEDPQSSDPLKKWNPQTGASSLGLVEVLSGDALYCTPEMLEKVLHAMPNEYGSWRDVDRHELCLNMRLRMDPEDDLSYGYLPAMLTTDLLDWDLGTALGTAADYAATEVFEKYADRLPWDSLLGSSDNNVLTQVLWGDNLDEEPEHFVSLANRLIELALAEDETRIFDLHVDEHSEVQPLERIVDKNFAGLLLAFMKNGLRQDTAIEGTDKTLRSILAASGNDSLTHLVQTFETRQRAMSALAEMEHDSAPAPAM